MPGKIFVVGFGPGNFEHITQRAKEALQESEYIIGYKTYVELIQGLLSHQEIISTGMTEEVSRAQEAVRQAELGKKVAVISSGDAGVYGMAGLIYEVLVEKGWAEASGVKVEVIPGVSAINSCASLLGAPIMHDACTISLSDHLTPWKLIAQRVEAAAQADFVIALYNPRSGRRTRQIVETQSILLKYRSPDTPVGLVKSAYRERQQVVLTTLAKMLEYEIGMLTTVIIGNSTTFVYDNKMITPRGYQRKYTLQDTEQLLRPHERLRPEAEPWALEQESDQESPQGSHESPQETHENPQGTIEEEGAASSFDMAMKALQALDPGPSTGSALSRDSIAITPPSVSPHLHGQQEAILELAVSPGVANKKFTSAQLLILADVTGEAGSLEYTPHHQIILRIPTSNPPEITTKLKGAGLILAPLGDVVQLKACDFCDGEKAESIPVVEDLHRKLGGLQVPKELKIGFNGCGMACYGAVNDDIGIVYRKGKFDLFLGAKTVGRNAHPGQPVAEGIEPDQLVSMMERIIHQFADAGHPNERFHKYFKRVKEIEGFKHQDMSIPITVEPAVCGD